MALGSGHLLTPGRVQVFKRVTYVWLYSIWRIMVHTVVRNVYFHYEALNDWYIQEILTCIQRSCLNQYYHSYYDPHIRNTVDLIEF